MSTCPSPWPVTAFLGLGALGQRMAVRALGAGVPLRVHNRNRAREEPQRALGSVCAASPAAAARQAEILCLSDDDPVTGGREGGRAGSLSMLVGGAAAHPGRQHRLRLGSALPRRPGRLGAGGPAPPLAAFLRQDRRRPRPLGRVPVPGCGRGHEAALLAELGIAAIGLDISGEALREARRLHGPERPELSWRQVDLLDPASLAAAGLADRSLQGGLEHTCFWAIDPARRADYLRAVTGLLAAGGWLRGLF